MAPRDEGLFPALETALKAATQPLDCHDLFDLPEVKAHALSANRVSDYLGGLWRKGLLVRLPQAASDGKRSRWAYQWKGRKTKYSGPISTDDASTALPEGAKLYTPRVLADRPSILITEEGSTITIELPNIVLVIRHK